MTLGCQPRFPALRVIQLMGTGRVLYLWGARTWPCLLSWSLDGSLGSVDEAAEGRTVLAPAARCEHGVGPRKVNARYVRGLSQVDGGA